MSVAASEIVGDDWSIVASKVAVVGEDRQLKKIKGVYLCRGVVGGGAPHAIGGRPRDREGVILGGGGQIF